MAKTDPVYEYKDNEHYKKYLVEKEELKKNYPTRIFHMDANSGNGTQAKLLKEYMENNDRELYRKYLKEISDILFKPDGNFQNMVWDTIGEGEEIKRERLARGRMNCGTGEYS